MKPSAKKSQLRPLGVFFRRFHLTVFIVSIIGALAAGVYFINNALTTARSGDAEPSQTTYGSPAPAGTTVDQSIIDRIDTLHTSSAPDPEPALPQGRANPFAE